MRLPFGAAQVLGHGPLDSGHAEDSFCVMRGHAIPEAPEIFEGGVTLSVKEGVLQAVGLVASKAIGDIHHMPRLEPFTLAHHRHKGIFLSFPGHPIVPTNVGPGKRFITNIKLRLECEGMTRGVRSQSELNGNALKRIKVDPIRIDIFKELRKSNPSRPSLFSRACVPRNEWEENLDSVAVKLLNHLTNRGNAAREIAQQIELIAIINAEVGIDVPHQDGIAWRRRLGKVHNSRRRDEWMPGFPFIGKNDG